MRKTRIGARRTENDYRDDALERLADEIADRLFALLGGPMPARAESLVDAAEIARKYGKTRSWVYEHAGELGAVRLGSGPRPRLAFSPARVAEQLETVDRPAAASVPEPAPPRRRRQRASRTASGAPLLDVRSREASIDSRRSGGGRRSTRAQSLGGHTCAEAAR